MNTEILKVLDIEYNIIKNNNIICEDNTKVDYKDVVCIKPWGHEFLAYESNKIGIWYLRINKGHGTSLHTHFKKDTFVIVLQGTAKLILINNEERILSPMTSVFVPKNKFHAFSCYSDEVYLMEIEIFDNETTFSNKNDLLRIDDQYCRKKTGYQGSINLDYDLAKYGHFYLNNNFKNNINGCNISTYEINDTMSEINLKGDYNIILSGEIYYNGLYLKEGSSIKSIDINKDTISGSCTILSIAKKYSCEDSKIIYSFDQLQVLINKLKQDNKKVVLTSGCYDIIHVGHLHTLKCAKNEGDILIVCLSNDEQIKSLKGENRPINKYEDRINLMKTIPYIDYLVLYDEKDNKKEETLGQIMKIVNPYCWVKGSDYKVEQILEKHPHLNKVVLIDLIKDKSTTNIINKITNPV